MTVLMALAAHFDYLTLEEMFALYALKKNFYVLLVLMEDLFVEF
jgi:hypothetical protein